MNITRQNYEEYFLLYVDNELNIVQRKAVEAFVEENPDLRAELIMLQDSILPADDEIVFKHKESLLRTSTAPNPVNETNCEEYFILYSDDELSHEQKDQVEQFVYRNPQHQASFELLQQVKLMPDSSVVFPDKYALYRHEEEEKKPVIVMRWWKIAAAAAVLLFIGGMGWYLAADDQAKQEQTAGRNGEQPQTTQPVQPARSNGQEGIADNNATKGQQGSTKIDDKAATVDQQGTPQATDQAANSDQQGVAVNKEEKKRSSNSPVVLPQSKKNEQEDIAVRNKQKKDNDQRNILVTPNVPPIEPLPDTDPKGQGLAGINPIDPTSRNGVDGTIVNHVDPSAMAVLTNHPTTDIYGSEPGSMDDEPNKKNRMRGFFRKVSRVFDKATNADPDNDKSSIRIASFEIGLK